MRITKVCAEHSGRDLTSDEYIVSIKRSGEISKTISQLKHRFQSLLYAIFCDYNSAKL